MRRGQSYQNNLHKALYGNTHTHTIGSDGGGLCCSLGVRGGGALKNKWLKGLKYLQVAGFMAMRDVAEIVTTLFTCWVSVHG